MKIKNILLFALCFLSLNIDAQQTISKTWVSDLGNGKYKNPILHSDYSDPDVCRVGNDYYMTASSFNCIPGLPILHSKDLVNWELIGYAINKLSPEDVFSSPQHGNGIWAPSIRYYNGEFYIYYGDPDYGIFMVKTQNPAGKWSEPTLVKGGKGLIDSCPLKDDDGKMYLVHAYAGSRAGIKSMLAVVELDSVGEKAVTEDKIVYDGHLLDPTIEGPKFYKRDGFYYIFAPAGGVSTGWQVALRSKNVYGPYERKVVMSQGKSTINGPHQGGWVNTPAGKDWFIHFQDKDAFGRVLHLQPMTWKNNFPIIGIDNDGDGCGEPVLEYKKPDVGKTYPIQTPPESDEFNSNNLGLQWQWNANPQGWWYFTDKSRGILSLFSVPISDNCKNLWNVPNMLLQKFPSDNFSATTKIKFAPSDKINGEKAGFVVMGLDYAGIILEKTDKGIILSQIECENAEKGTSEIIYDSIPVSNSDIYFKISVNPKSECVFSYSLDGVKYNHFGKKFIAKPGKWIGAKLGFFCTRPIKNNDGGKMEVDWIRLEK